MSSEPWYRLFFRKGRPIIIRGAAALEKAKARKAPKLVHFEEARAHTCDTCGKHAPWDDDWRHLSAIDDARADPADRSPPKARACSAACQARCLTRALPSWRWFFWEPGEHAENWRARWQAEQADRASQREARTYPMPVFPPERTGGGWCRWCGDKIDLPRAKQRLWHPECKREWLLRIDLHVQFRFLVARDGYNCAICGEMRGRWVAESWAGQNAIYWGHYAQDETWLSAEERKLRSRREGNETLGWYTPIRWQEREALEVDHIIPLWKAIEDYPLEERRELFGPDNLWLLCQVHHKAKSKAEAAERAERRRSAA